MRLLPCHPLPEFIRGQNAGGCEGAPLALRSGDSSLWPGHRQGRGHPGCHPASPPLGHVPGRLQEPRVVVLLQDVLRLVDEDRRALETLPAVGDLLGQLPQLHHLQREAKVLRERHAEGGCELPGGRDHLQQGPAAFWGCGRAFAAASILKLKARGCSKRRKDRKGVRGMGEQELEN